MSRRGGRIPRARSGLGSRRRLAGASCSAATRNRAGSPVAGRGTCLRRRVLPVRAHHQPAAAGLRTSRRRPPPKASARTGELLVILSGSPLRDEPNAEGFPGKDGKLIGRAGVPNPLIKTPFYLAGWGLDALGSGGEQYTWRNRVLWFALPVVAALAVAFFFLVMWRLRRSMAWAIALAAIFAVGSLAWPYSKAGQETVLMMSSILTFAAVLYAQESRSWRPWAAARLRGRPRARRQAVRNRCPRCDPRAADQASDASRWETRGRYLLAFSLPLLAWAAMFGFYNWTRTGGVLDTGRSDPGFTFAAPFNFIGFFISPGKGLIFYSPVVVLGILGLRRLWREQPRVATVDSRCCGRRHLRSCRRFHSGATSPGGLGTSSGLLGCYCCPFHGGSRPEARLRALGAIVALAVAIQSLAVVAPPPALVVATKDLTGQPIFHRSPAEAAGHTFWTRPDSGGSPTLPASVPSEARALQGFDKCRWTRHNDRVCAL